MIYRDTLKEIIKLSSLPRRFLTDFRSFSRGVCSSPPQLSYLLAMELGLKVQGDHSFLNIVINRGDEFCVSSSSLEFLVKLNKRLQSEGFNLNQETIRPIDHDHLCFVFYIGEKLLQNNRSLEKIVEFFSSMFKKKIKNERRNEACQYCGGPSLWDTKICIVCFSRVPVAKLRELYQTEDPNVLNGIQLNFLRRRITDQINNLFNLKKFKHRMKRITSKCIICNKDLTYRNYVNANFCDLCMTRRVDLYQFKLDYENNKIRWIDIERDPEKLKRYIIEEI